MKERRKQQLYFSAIVYLNTARSVVHFGNILTSIKPEIFVLVAILRSILSLLGCSWNTP